MSEPTAIRVPLDNVNDETVKLVNWLVQEGQEVHEGQLLAEVETSKALVEMIAPLAGKVWIRVQAGHDVPVGAVVAYITTNGASSQPPAIELPQRVNSTENDLNSSSSNTASVLPPGTSFSKKALELLEQHQIPAEQFAGRGMVREQHVRQYLEQKTSSGQPAAELHFALGGLRLDQVSLPRAFADKKSGLVDAQFLDGLRSRPEAFSALPSSEKCNLYRKHGANIGDGVILGPGTIVIAPQIVIAEGTQFAENSSIHCRERFCVGALTSFRRNLTVRGGTVVLGESIFAGQNIQIGGGGNADPWSLLCIGDDTYIGDDVFINICRPVLIGREVFLTQRSLLVTHNIGHSVLEGFENRFAPIVLEDFSQIGMNSTVYAGSWVGRSAIVGSNSYVISSIPAGKLAMGVPARVLRDAARPLDRPRQLELVQKMVRDYHELLQLKGHQPSVLENSPHLQFTLQHLGKRFQFIFVESFLQFRPDPEPAGETVIWTFDSSPDALHPGSTLMNLLKKEITGPSGLFANSTREFLRKRGIRCKPGPWRYRQGLI
jgi:acetyltransferase-like isoleucine patch superfamily enzyme